MGPSVDVVVLLGMAWDEDAVLAGGARAPNPAAGGGGRQRWADPSLRCGPTSPCMHMDQPMPADLLTASSAGMDADGGRRLCVGLHHGMQRSGEACIDCSTWPWPPLTGSASILGGVLHLAAGSAVTKLWSSLPEQWVGWAHHAAARCQARPHP